MRVWMSLIVLLALSAPGCCSCLAPYDECGPTFAGCGDQCWAHHRMGSAFTDKTEPAEYVPPEPTPARQPAAPAQ